MSGAEVAAAHILRAVDDDAGEEQLPAHEEVLVRHTLTSIVRCEVNAISAYIELSLTKLLSCI